MQHAAAAAAADASLQIHKAAEEAGAATDAVPQHLARSGTKFRVRLGTRKLRPPPPAATGRSCAETGLDSRAAPISDVAVLGVPSRVALTAIRVDALQHLPLGALDRSKVRRMPSRPALWLSRPDAGTALRQRITSRRLESASPNLGPELTPGRALGPTAVQVAAATGCEATCVVPTALRLACGQHRRGSVEHGKDGPQRAAEGERAKRGGCAGEMHPARARLDVQQGRACEWLRGGRMPT